MKKFKMERGGLNALREAGAADMEKGDLNEDPNGEESLLDSQMEPTGDIEVDDASEAKIINSTLASSKSEVMDNMGMGYYYHVMFANEEQAREFLEQALELDRVEMIDEICIDGIQLAAELGIELTPAVMRFPGERQERRLVEEVGVIDPPQPEKGAMNEAQKQKSEEALLKPQRVERKAEKKSSSK